jgi:predicted DNA-binding protein (UPF0251 family)
MSLFIIYYYFIKGLFTKQFHADIIAKTATQAVNLCFMITFITQLTFVFILVKFDLSFYTNIYLGIALGLLSYILSDLAERKFARTLILKDKTKLLEACKEANLTKEATNRLVLKYIDGLKNKEIAELENVEEATVWQSLRRSRRKLNIQSDD